MLFWWMRRLLYSEKVVARSDDLSEALKELENQVHCPARVHG